MRREVDRLSGRTFDVLVIGGGIYGLAIAYDATQRGLSVALIERDDFGSGASFNHLRTIHGGLRYLQTLDVRRARESVRERRTVARIAPQAVRPLAFAIPLYRSLLRGTAAMRAGLLLDRLLAFDRNRDVPRPLHLPGGRVMGRAAAIQAFPGLKRHGLTGAALVYDYVTVEPDRLTFAYALAAAEHGAVLVNHLEATALAADGGRIVGVRGRDTIDGRAVEVAAKTTVNATGGRVDRLLQPLGLGTGVPMLKAMNLVTRREAADEALGGRSAAGRYLFLVPWRARALFGTWESNQPILPAPDGATTQDPETVAERDVAAFLAELNEAFPNLDLSFDDVTLVHRGIVPARIRRGRVALEGHERVRDHAAQGVEGLVSVAGTKYTTARAVAERVVTRLLQKLGLPPVPCRTGSTVLPGGGLRDVGAAVADLRRSHERELPSETIPHLVAAYGSRCRDVLEIAAARADWRTRVASDSPVVGAELILAARHEMAVTLADAVIRRTPLGSLGYPGDEAVAAATAIVGEELGWTDDRRRVEMAAVRRVYQSPATAV